MSVGRTRLEGIQAVLFILTLTELQNISFSTPSCPLKQQIYYCIVVLKLVINEYTTCDHPVTLCPK